MSAFDEIFSCSYESETHSCLYMRRKDQAKIKRRRSAPNAWLGKTHWNHLQTRLV